MPLRGKKPQEVKKRLKMLLYGLPGVGKTTAAIQFPSPYLMDTERGAENDSYVRALEASGGAYFGVEDGAGDLDEMIGEVRALLSEEHPYRTLVVDPLTVPYNDAVDRSADTLGTDFGRHKVPVDRKVRHLCSLLSRLDMNVIITSHAKAKWERTKDAKGKDVLSQAGMTFDGYSRLDYIFDLVIELQRTGDRVVGIVRKTRMEAFPLGTAINWSYKEFADLYGADVLEKESEIDVLASDDEVAHVKRLLATLSWPEETTDTDAGKRVGWRTWLEKAQADDWSEMPQSKIQKVIEFLLKEIKKAEAA